MALKDVSVLVLPDGRVDTTNAASYLGFSRKTLAMMRSSGKGPRFIKRGRVFYYVDDLRAWIKDGEAQSTSQARSR